MPEQSDDQSICTKAERLSEKLRSLTSLITHARGIEQDTEALVRCFREQYIDARVYPVDASLAVNLSHLKEILGDSYDFKFREFLITPLHRKAALIYSEVMANEELISTHIVEKLTLPPVAGLVQAPSQDEALAYLKNTLLTASFTEESALGPAVKEITAGETMLLVDGVASILIVATRKLESRAITEPDNEPGIRSTRDGFVEDLRINVSLVRRRFKDPNLVVKRFTVGVRSSTAVAVVYFRGIVNPQLVCEVERRLENVNIDMMIGMTTIQGLIEDHPYSPFPTTLTTERPDKFVAAIGEGKVGLLVAGTPFSVLAPATFTDFFQASDDYTEKWLVTSVIRFTRFVTALLAMVTPALYVAVTTFHPGLLPTPLTMSIAISRMGVPFPALIEALIMESLLEVLQEAGVRLPKNVGSAVSIVGGLVVGEAAVRAGLVSAPIVIITAVTAIASFSTANYRLNLNVRLFRVPLMVLAASFGMFGVVLGLLAIVIHLCMIESFGEPYLAPLIPRNTARFSDLKDTLIVVPPDLRKTRPAYLEPEDSQRQGGD